MKQFFSTGLVCLGKTALPEFGLTATTESLAFGTTRNPWHTDYSTGGSSGGSAALVASGVVPLAHGNDGGGSIRIPASCCGLVGLKPSRGRLERVEGSRLMPVDIIYEGILTRTVRDTATFYHGAEKYRRAPRMPEIGDVKHPGKKRLRRSFHRFTLRYACTLRGQPIWYTTHTGDLCEELGHTVRNPLSL